MAEEYKERPTATVTATIKSKAESENGYRLELLIPRFGGKYPVVISRVPVERAKGLLVGKTYTLTLEQQNIRKQKDGTPYDGSQSWMYWWGLDDVPDQTKVLPEDAPWPPKGDTAEEQEQSPLPWRIPTSADSLVPPDRQRQIMLQHASGVVAQAFGDYNRLPPGTRGTFNDYLQKIAIAATWLERNVYEKGGFSPAVQKEETEDDSLTI